MRVTIPLAALLALGCATTQGASEHATHDDPNRQVAGAGVEPPQASLAFLNVLEGPVPPEGARGAVASVRTTVATVADGVIPGSVQLDPTWAVRGIAIGLIASIVAAVLPAENPL